MALTKTIVVEGLADNGIPVGELQQFCAAAINNGTGHHALAMVSIDKVKDGDNLVRLSVETTAELGE